MKQTTFLAAFSATLIALMLGCLLGTAIGTADGQDDSEGAVSPFKAPFVMPILKVDRRSGAILENAKIERLGDDHFLVGTTADYGNPDDWTTGKVTWFAIDELISITEIPDLEEHKKLNAREDE